LFHTTAVHPEFVSLRTSLVHSGCTHITFSSQSFSRRASLYFMTRMLHATISRCTSCFEDSFYRLLALLSFSVNLAGVSTDEAARRARKRAAQALTRCIPAFCKVCDGKDTRIERGKDTIECYRCARCGVMMEAGAELRKRLVPALRCCDWRPMRRTCSAIRI
jgi:hypothetical protein